MPLSDPGVLPQLMNIVKVACMFISYYYIIILIHTLQQKILRVRRHPVLHTDTLILVLVANINSVVLGLVAFSWLTLYSYWDHQLTTNRIKSRQFRVYGTRFSTPDTCCEDNKVISNINRGKLYGYYSKVCKCETT